MKSLFSITTIKVPPEIPGLAITIPFIIIGLLLLTVFNYVLLSLLFIIIALCSFIYGLYGINKDYCLIPIIRFNKHIKIIKKEIYLENIFITSTILSVILWAGVSVYFEITNKPIISPYVEVFLGFLGFVVLNAIFLIIGLFRDSSVNIFWIKFSNETQHKIKSVRFSKKQKREIGENMIGFVAKLKNIQREHKS